MQFSSAKALTSVAAALGVLANSFEQHARQLQVTFGGSADDLNGNFSVCRFAGWEAISEGSEFNIELLSATTHTPLKRLIGAPVTLSVLSDGFAGDARRLCGIMTRAEQLGSNNGLSLYRITLQSSLQLLSRRRNNRVFGERSVVDVVNCLLKEHQAFNPLLQWQLKLSGDYPARAYTVQYRESDFDFLDRLLRREGIYWYVDHAGSAAGEHRIVFCDNNPALPGNTASPVRFHRAAMTEARNTITRWHGARSLMPGVVALSSFDYKQGQTAQAETPTNHDHGDDGNGLAAGLEDYDAVDLHYGVDNDDLNRYATLRMNSHEVEAKQFEGLSSVPELCAGSWFELSDHAIHDADSEEDRQFVLLRVEHRGRNNFDNIFDATQHPLLAPRNDDADQTYENRLIAIRRAIPYSPPFDPVRHAPPTAPGPQIALVVGPAGQEIHTDEWGRIKVHFPFQRPQDHRPGETGSTADLSGDDSCWIRVAQNLAGSSWGARFIPRIGQEVVVDFLDGNVERPIVRQALNDADNKEARFSRVSTMPGDKTLSGIKSKEHFGDAYSELLFDDTPTQVRARLASSPGQTELNLGYLTEPRQEGKAKARGQGAELRTDDSLALRSARGMLLSAWSQLNANGVQLQRDDYLALMEDCVALFKALGQHAADCAAQATDLKPHEKLHKGIQRWEDGSNTKPDAPADAGAQMPIIGITAPEGISLVTPAAVTSYAGSNHDTVAQQHIQVTAGQHLNLHAGKGVSVFAADEGIKVLASQGDVLVQSQHGNTTINASKDMTLTAKNMTLMADSIKLITTDGSFVSLDSLIKLGTNGNIEQHGAAFPHSGPSTMSAALPQFSKVPSDQKFVLKYHGHTPDALVAANREYKITLDDGSVVKGRTDAQGKTSLLHKDAMHIADVQVLTKKPD